MTPSGSAPAEAPPAKTAPTKTAPAKAPAKASGPGFVPLLLGGLVAGAIGFVIATFAAPRPEAVATVDPARVEALEADIAALEATPAPEVDLADIEGAQADLASRFDELTARVAALEAPQEAAPQEQATGEDVAPSPRIEELQAGLDGLSQDVSDLASQVETLGGAVEDRGAEVSAQGETLTALQGDVTALRDDLTPRVAAVETGLAEANERASSVVSDAEALARESARNQVRLALQSGAPFADPLAILGDDAPEALAGSAETGVPAQAALIDAFPALSREALRAARAAAPAAGVGSLFQNAFNPRSLSPREGDDPDAVLSRAEAAVREGDLTSALSEIETLPEDARAVLDPWTQQAKARAAALAAADEYLQDG